MTSGDVKLCIICDSAISANLFASLAMQVIQPMVLRLQDKHAECKLTVGIVTYTTPTTRPAIVARRAFTHAGALFPLLREAPHSIGIGTSGSGGPIGMAILEGLVAAIEMCDEVLEAPARRQRTRHPSIPAQSSAPPIFHFLLIGGSRPDFARRPYCNRSAALDDTTWDTLPDELKKRNINLSLCLSNQIKELVTLHTKLWPSPDPVWFPKPKGCTILLAGTHMANAKRQLEAPTSGPSPATASKRPKNDSPKPAARPIPPKIDLPAPTFSPPQPAPASIPAPAPAPVTVPPSAPPVPVPAPAPAPAPTAAPVPAPTSAPAPAPAPEPAPVPHPPSIPQPQQQQSQLPKFDVQLIKSYHQLRMMLINPNTSAEQRSRLLSTGFKMDESGSFLGAAGIILDAKGQPGPGAMVPLKVHAERLRQIQMLRASGPGNPATQQMVRMIQLQQQQQQQVLAAAVASGAVQALNPNQPPSQPESNPSPSHHRSPSHTQAQPSEAQPHPIPQPGHAFQPGGNPSAPNPQAPFHPAAASPAHPPGGTPHMQAGVPPNQHGHPATPQQPIATGTPSHPISISTPQHASTPQHLGMTPPQGTPQLAHSTPQAMHSTPKFAHSTPQMAHATPQMAHSTPQMAHSTPQMAQATPQQIHDQMMSVQHQSPTTIQGMPGAGAQVMPGSAQHPGNPIQMQTGLPGAGGTTPGQGANSGVPTTTSNVWRGQIVYLLQQRPDQEPASLHFSVIAAGAPNKSMQTHRWPTRLTNTNGFKHFPANLAAQLYNSAVPFGQITIDQDHAGTDLQKWQVFQKIVTTGWCIFYEFPSDRTLNPALNPAQGSRGVLFFSAPQAQGRVLFKAFVNQPCPPQLTRGGQPAGPALTRPNPQAGGSNPAASQPAVPAPVSAPKPVAPSISPAPGIGAVPGIPGAPGAPPSIPGTGMVPGAGIPGMPGRPNPTPTPPNPNPNANASPVPPAIPGTGVPGVGLNPAMMQGFNPAAIAAMNATGNMNALNQAGIPGAGLNPGMVPGLNPAAVAAAGMNSAAQNNLNRAISQMTLARLGITPAELAAAPPPQKQVMLMRIQQLMPIIRQQVMQQNMANMSVGMQQRAAPQPGMPGGQPGLEHLQQFIRSQQQQQQQQRQG